MIMRKMTAPACREIDFRTVLPILPMGAIEQHGPHLPCDTDTLIIENICKEVELRFPDKILLLPALWLGHSPHHTSFGATLSVDHTVHAAVLTAICKSLNDMGAIRVLLLNGHGGNMLPANMALQSIKNLIPSMCLMAACYWDIASGAVNKIRESGDGGIGHACELETSLYMFLEKAFVSSAEICDGGHGNSPAGEEYQSYMLKGSPLIWIDDFSEITKSGVFGKPSLASVEKGRAFFNAIVDCVCHLIEQIEEEAFI